MIDLPESTDSGRFFFPHNNPNYPKYRLIAPDLL
jgi:hypothetical protein